MESFARDIRRWLNRTPVQTFILCPLTVIAFEFAWQRGWPDIAWWDAPVMLWGYLQYKLVGLYRSRRAGGGPGMDTMPDRILDDGPYALTRNPMYLGHVIFLAGLVITFRSWFALILFAARAAWFHLRVLHDERHLRAAFGAEYEAYCTRVKRWMPYLF